MARADNKWLVAVVGAGVRSVECYSAAGLASCGHFSMMALSRSSRRQICRFHFHRPRHGSSFAAREIWHLQWQVTQLGTTNFQSGIGLAGGMCTQDWVSRLEELDARGDIAQALELCASEACSEITQCQRYLGWYHASQGDPELACEWYRKAVIHGSTEANEEYFTCVLMVDAKGDKGKAVDLCLQPPMSLYVNCQRYLAKAFYSQGDSDATLLWCVRVAEHGEREDVLYAGRMFLSRNEPLEALTYLERAAFQGSAHANQLLGEIHAFGLGIPKDEDLAIDHYRAAADGGLMLSRIRLIHLHLSRVGYLRRLFLSLGLILIIMKVIFIKVKNKNDIRLADIPR